MTVIQPNQDPNGKYWLNSAIITEFGVSLAESFQPDADSNNEDKCRCYLCKK